MTRQQLLLLLVAQARSNGFEFRHWYSQQLGHRWESATQAVTALTENRRYYALLFSHEFASHFWKAGTRITFQVPPQSFTRRMSDGRIATVHRKSFMRRSARENAWLYHLKQMAASDDPLRYMRRYLRVADELDPEAISLEGHHIVVLDDPRSANAPPAYAGSAADGASRAPDETASTVQHSAAPAPGG